MKNIDLKIIRIGIFIFTAYIVISCKESIEHIVSPSTGPTIAFSTNANDKRWDEETGYKQTRIASHPHRHFCGLMGEDSVFITITEEDNTNNLQYCSSNNQKTRSPYSVNEFTSFKVSALLDDGSLWLSGITVNDDNNDKKWTCTSGGYWPPERLHFFGFAQNTGTGISPVFSISNGTYNGYFVYELPSDQTEANDAALQPDLIFAITPEQTATNNPIVDMDFYHALSAIIIKWGTLPEDVTIADATISLKNVVANGRCALKHPLKDNDNYNISWELENTTDEYRIEHFKGEGSNNETFMMIPQQLDTDAQIGISIKVGEKIYNYTKNIKELTEKWETNKRYTYTISIGEEVKVGIEEEVATLTEKRNVKIQNTGLSTSYIRATIVGYWESADGSRIISPWDINESGIGTFEKSDDWDNHWIKGADGFFYHKEPVKPGDYTKVPLFNSYILKSKGPEKDSKLIINIVAQAISVDLRNEKWPAIP